MKTETKKVTKEKLDAFLNKLEAGPLPQKVKKKINSGTT
jgi:hypothetical protein